jgi:fused signal recognition particle receptor
MFGFLKKKLKSAISNFSKKASEEPEEEIKETKEKIEKKSEVKEKPKKEVKKSVEEPKEKAEEKLKEELVEKEKHIKEEIKDIEEKQVEILEEEKEIIKEEQELEKEVEEEPIEKEESETESKEESVEKKESEILEEEKEILEKEKLVEKEISIEQEKEEEKEESTEEIELEQKEDIELKPEEPQEISLEKELVEKEVQDIIKIEEEKKLEKERIEKEKEFEALEEKKQKKSFFKFFKKKEKEPEEKTLDKEPEEEKEVKKEKPEKKVEIKEKLVEEKKEPIPDIKEKKGIFTKVVSGITTTKIDESKFDELFDDLEFALLENNVAFEVIDKIKEDLKENIVSKPLTRNKIAEIIEQTLKKSIKEILEVETIDVINKIKTKKPYIICFVGINGSGKTTTIAKFANLLKKNNLTIVMSASDTFRAAAIDQLQYHADKLDVKLIKQDYGADPAAVSFDAIKHAEAKGIDVVLIDTAGRMHSNSNLIDEMKKIIRVSKPDLKIFVGESITGNDCIEQAKKFNDAIEIDGIILSKADVDEKGGAALSVSYITKKPILYIGTGQGYDDIKEFSSDLVISNLGI